MFIYLQSLDILKFDNENYMIEHWISSSENNVKQFILTIFRVKLRNVTSLTSKQLKLYF